MQAGVGEAVEEGVEGLAAGEHEVAVNLLGDGRVEAQGRGEVHEVAFCDADDVVGVGNDPVLVGVVGFVGEDALLVIVEVWRSTIPSIQRSDSSMGCFGQPRCTPYCFAPVVSMTRLSFLDAPVMSRASRKLANIAPLTSQFSCSESFCR